ncbi:hypothetical protein [Paenibacillus sp. S29]|uniref:hypothetical protein n=2 Tax=Paenibacillus TaxID=44249 RepID=UPI0039BF02BB
MIQKLRLAMEEYYHDSDEADYRDESKDYSFWSRISFFYYEAREFEVQEDDCEGKLVNIHSFERKDTPYFLEGPTRAMKVVGDIVNGQELYRQIRQSGLYDRKLGMYKVNESLARQPFGYDHRGLSLRLKPKLPGWLFTATGELSFCFLGSCQVTYFNTDRKDTYAPKCRATQYVLHYVSGEKKTISHAVLDQKEAQDVREWLISRIGVYWGT